jgi:hypothetical protein
MGAGVREVDFGRIQMPELSLQSGGIEIESL